MARQIQFWLLLLLLSCAAAVAGEPDFSVETLILKDLSRMTGTTGLDTALSDLAAHPRVDGVVVDLSAIAALTTPWGGGRRSP